MALSSRALIRVPPDGAGKGIYAHHLRYVEYTGAVNGETTFGVDDQVVGAESGAVARIVYVQPTSSTSGSIAVVFLTLSDIDVDFNVPEDLLVDGAMRARTSSQESLYVSKTEVVGANNPAHGQHVDVQGQAFTRFAEGAIQFDAFGRTQTADLTALGVYGFTYGDSPLLTTIVEGDGALAHQANDASLLLSTTTAAGDKVTKRSDRWHKTSLGQSTLCFIGLRLGEGKTGLLRKWGMFDDGNGVYWEEVDGELRCGHRQNTQGFINSHGIPRADWNVDRLDGTGPSRFVLDKSAVNIYWVDYQWGGGGKARFGVFGPDGRIVAHVMDHINDSPNPLLRGGSIPFSVEQENAGATISSSEMRLFAGGVYMEGEAVIPNPTGWSYSAPDWTLDHADGWVYLGSVQPSETFAGRPNHTTIVYDSFALSAIDTTTGEPIPAQVRSTVGDVLPNRTWNALDGVNPNTAVDIDVTDHRGVAGATMGLTISAFISPGIHEVDYLKHERAYLTGSTLVRKADGGSTPVGTWVRLLKPGAEATITSHFTWREIRD